MPDRASSPPRAAGLAALLCVAGAMAGCGESARHSAAKETDQPLKIQHALGQTKVPGRAGRPVTLYTSELDDAIALGATPVGATVPDGATVFPRYLGAPVRHMRRVGTVSRPNLGRIASLQPDVILATVPSDRRLYRRLDEIAPTVAADEAVDWKPNLRQDAEVLGRTDAGEAMLSGYDRRALRVRRALRGRTRALRLPTEARRALRRPFVVSVLKDVGVPHPPAGPNRVPGARAGRYDEWTFGVGVIAANRLLDDLRRWGGRG
jgi:iron complex transport system substrate-binding protein